MVILPDLLLGRLQAFFRLLQKMETLSNVGPLLAAVRQRNLHVEKKIPLSLFHIRKMIGVVRPDSVGSLKLDLERIFLPGNGTEHPGIIQVAPGGTYIRIPFKAFLQILR